MKKQIARLPVLKTYNNDLTKQWYVEFYCLNPESGRLERVKRYGTKESPGINKFETVDERMDAAAHCIKFFTNKLKIGWNAFADETAVYENNLIYDKDEWKGRDTVRLFTIEYYINQVLDEKKSLIAIEGFREKSYQTYLAKARNFIKYLKEKKLHNMPIQAFTDKHAMAYITFVSASGKHNITRNSYISTMSRFWKLIIKKYPKLKLQNPWLSVDRVKTESTPLNAFTTLQIEKVKNYMMDHDQYLLMICEVVYYCFLRPCRELPQIRIRDLNVDLNCIIVPAKVSKNKKTQPVKVPKQLMNKLLALELWKYPDDYYLFGKHGPEANKAGRDYFSNRFKSVLTKLKFGKGYAMYSWKHTGNRRLAESDLPIKFAQLQNRHHSLEQTDKYQRSLTLKDNERLHLEFPDM